MNKTELLLIYLAVCSYMDLNGKEVNPMYFELKNKIAEMIKSES
jgi:hypothetical protein